MAFTVTQYGHGYITGNIVHIAGPSAVGSWSITVVDYDHYELTTFLSGTTKVGTVDTSGVDVTAVTGSDFTGIRAGDVVTINGSDYFVDTVADSTHMSLTASAGTNVGVGWGWTFQPKIGDSVYAELQTSQCSFNPGAVTPYLENVYKHTAAIMSGAGLTPSLQFGEVGHWFFSKRMSIPISGFADSGGLIKVSTATPHGFSSGQTVILAGTTIVDGTKYITVIDANSFTVDGSTWPGGSPSAKGTVSGGGMAYYDENQKAAAITALGRPLVSFYTQDDDPSSHTSDVNFLASRIKDHTDTIVAAVKSSYPSAIFEVLWPNDVNFVPCYYTAVFPYPQGGRLNLAVNLPSGWKSKSGSNFDRFKIEALSWGATYRNIDNAYATINYPFKTIYWSKADSRYLIPWFNGGCPWPLEFIFSNRESVPGINFWAFDHFVLFSWPLPLPVAVGAANILQF